MRGFGGRFKQVGGIKGPNLIIQLQFLLLSVRDFVTPRIKVERTTIGARWSFDPETVLPTFPFPRIRNEGRIPIYVFLSARKTASGDTCIPPRGPGERLYEPWRDPKSSRVKR